VTNPIHIDQTRTRGCDRCYPPVFAISNIPLSSTSDLAVEGLVQRTLCADCVRILEASCVSGGSANLLYTHTDDVVVGVRGLSVASKSGGASVTGNIVRLLQRLECKCVVWEGVNGSV
jgi:hypothetical protein